MVYEFLEKDNVQNILKDDEQAIAFDWNKRVNVIKDVANALFYMHYDCSPPIIHRDISSKNVLLDLEYVAHVSDFGTAKFLNPNSSNWTSFVGTFGYAAPGQFSFLLIVQNLIVFQFLFVGHNYLYLSLSLQSIFCMYDITFSLLQNLRTQ